MTSHMYFLPIVTVALLCLCRWTDCIQVKKDLLHCEMRMNLWTKKMIVWAFCVWALGQKKPNLVSLAMPFISHVMGGKFLIFLSASHYLSARGRGE